MKTLSKLTFLLLFTLISGGAFAQRYGVIIDETAFNNSPKVVLPETGERSGSTNIRLDLSNHAPLVQNQDKLNSCVAYAIVYNALGIEMAIQNNNTNKEEITALTSSPIYLFKKINRNRCSDAMDLTATIQYIENNGLLQFNYLPGNGCMVNITREMEAEAAKNRIIKKVQGLPFNSKDPWEKKHKAILEVLDKKNKPVVVGMYVVDTVSFNRLKFPSEVYLPKVASNNEYNVVDQARQHAITIVGYDRRRGAYKILNSWGQNWGNDGYCWIPFETMGRSARAAYYLVLNEIQTNNTPLRGNIFEGQFGFQYVNNTDFVKEMPYHTGKGIYELNKKNWKVEQLFQITTKNGNSGQSICVFSIDADNKVELHWPFSTGMGTGDQMPNKNTEMVLPGEDTALEIQKAGTDNLVVLYSKNPIITQWSNIQRSLENSGNNPDIISRLRIALGDRLIPSAEISYQPSGMNFSTNSTKGDTVPIILKIQSTK